MLDAIHLLIEIPGLEVFPALSFIGFVETMSSYSGSTGAGSRTLALSVDWSDLAGVIKSYMRGKQDENMTIVWAMATKSVPSGLSSEWKASKSTKWEELTPSLLEKWGHISIWIVVVDLIWACWVGVPIVLGLSLSPLSLRLYSFIVGIDVDWLLSLSHDVSYIIALHF